MFYTIFENLCTDKGIRPGRAADEMGINRGTVTSWKKNGYTPQANQLQKISEYFRVPSDFLLERPPFDCWGAINENRKHFLNCADLDPDKLKLIWGVDLNRPDEAPLAIFVTFISGAVISAHLTQEGDWHIEVRPEYKKRENKKSPDDESELNIDTLEYALYGEARELDEDEKKQLLELAQFMRKKRQEQDKNK